MDEEKLNYLNHEIFQELGKLPVGSDMGDIGNCIGYVLSQYFINEDKESFLSGIDHGISLIEGEK